MESQGLKIENLKVSLQKQEILHGIDFEMQDGEFISLLGPSGCGKTTLLKTIAGLLEADEGNIILHGKNMNQVAPEKRGTVIVFQDLRLFPHMTVEKNIAFAMDLKKIDKKTQQETIQNLLREVRLEGFEKRKIRELSGGQQQRIAIARALAADPQILLLDEPFSGLDESLRREMGSLVKRLQRERNITMILVTHDKREALQMSDKIALMLSGHMVQFADPKTLYYEPVSKEAAEYFGKVNYFRGNVKDGEFHSELLNFSVKQASDKNGEKKEHYPDGVYDAMVRPGDIRIQEGDRYEIKDIIFMGDSVEIELWINRSNCGNNSEQYSTNLEIPSTLTVSCSSKEVVEKMWKTVDKVDISVDNSKFCLYFG